MEAAKATLAEGKGTLAFCCHIGCWELFGACVAVQVGGLHALASSGSNPRIEKYLLRSHEEMSIHTLNTADGLRPVLAALKKGSPIDIMIDQNVRTAFVPATFFGRTAATTSIIAALALRCNLPVFAVYCYRKGHAFRHHGHLEGPVELIRTGDREADILANTQRFNDMVERAIRRHPEQWLWTYNRWRLADQLESGRRDSADSDEPADEEATNAGE